MWCWREVRAVGRRCWMGGELHSEGCSEFRHWRSGGVEGLCGTPGGYLKDLGGMLGP